METSIFAPIDNYCERTGPEIWSEPLNALTNLFFIGAGIWGLWQVNRHGAGTFAKVLCWMAIAIGIGSGLFHTWANHLTKWGDIIPIAIFVFTYTLFNLKRFFGFGWGLSVILFVLFYAVAGFITWAMPASVVAATNGTIGYLPAWLGLAFFGTILVMRGHPAGKFDLTGAAILLVAATCRSVDMEVCAALPIGTHFLWHTLNGILLGVLLTAAARYGHPEGLRSAWGRDARPLAA